MILETQKLTKNYGKLCAVNQLDLQVESGQIFGMLGPNGSGKTTTLGMLLGVTNPTSGDYLWFGKQGDYRARKRIGAILEMPVFYPYMNAVQNLEIACIIKDVDYSRIDPALEMVSLLERKADKFKGYSLGMKQRLAIASAFLTNPDVLILDEPTNGLDPMGIADIRNLIRDIANMGKTIILASHLLDEVQKVCSHFCVLRQGDLIYQGSVKDDFSDKNILLLNAPNQNRLKEVLVSFDLVLRVNELDNGLEVECELRLNPDDLNKMLVARDVFLNHLSVRHRSLEEQFIKILGENHEKTV